MNLHSEFVPVWISTVNTASRMESNSKKNRIHCSKASAQLLQKEGCTLPLVARGNIKVKGKGKMFTVWVNEEDEDADAGSTDGLISLDLDIVEELGESKVYSDASGMLSAHKCMNRPRRIESHSAASADYLMVCSTYLVGFWVDELIGR